MDALNLLDEIKRLENELSLKNQIRQYAINDEIITMCKIVKNRRKNHDVDSLLCLGEHLHNLVKLMDIPEGSI